MMLLLVFVILLLTRLIGLNWGQPFYFHPDENNMAVALASLKCQNVFDLKNCFNPHFYAYGQLSLYLGKLLLPVFHSPHYSLRFLSAFYSIIGGLIFYKLIKRDFKSSVHGLIGLLLYVFSPVLIQLSHFGTTESLLILLMILALYFRKKLLILGLIIGVAAAVKISSLNLLLLPLLSYRIYNRKLPELIWSYCLAFLALLLLSPHNWLNFPDFFSALNYETQVATGTLPVFYTEQFQNTVPIFFQIKNILIYGLGPLMLITSVLGSIYLTKRRTYYPIIVFVYLFVTTSLTFVKWTRFLAFCYPLVIYMSVAGLVWFKNSFIKKYYWLFLIIILLQICFGLNFSSLYLKPDVRLEANHWLSSNLPSQSLIITESGNVIDLPLDQFKHRVSSYFLYDLDKNPVLARAVFQDLDKTDYVIVPSRRIYANYSCFWFVGDQPQYNENCSKAIKYPNIDRYYRQLFWSEDFKLIASFRRLNDEMAEETWTVFDHPVIRVYQRK